MVKRCNEVSAFFTTWPQGAARNEFAEFMMFSCNFEHLQRKHWLTCSACTKQSPQQVLNDCLTGHCQSLLNSNCMIKCFCPFNFKSLILLAKINENTEYIFSSPEPKAHKVSL